jgi:signal transduction histidine kinase
MFTALRSRLLLSYGAVIVSVMVLLSLFLLLFSSFTRRIDLEQDTLRLVRASRTTLRELEAVREPVVDEAAVARRLNAIADEQEVRIWGIDPQTGRIIFDTEELWLDQSFNLMPIPAGQLNNLQSTINLPPNTVLGRQPDPGGGNWLIYTHPVVLRQRPVTLAYGIREIPPIEAFRRVFFTPLLQASCFAFLIAGLLASLMSRWIARPLQEMAVATQALAQGEYNHRLVENGPAEIQQLAKSFNNMTYQVQLTNQAQKEFVANVSHDLKTPLTSIQGWSQALLDGAAATPAQQARAAQVIYGESERMARLVNQLLDLAKLEAGTFSLTCTVLNLNLVVQQVLQNLQPQATQQQITLTAQLPPLPAPVWGDADRLMQIVTNLVENSLAHTPTNGRVEVRILNLNRTLALSVTDTGSGIPPQELPRIFERFYQADKSRAQRNGRHNQGLGLAITKQLVEAHNGQIEVRSQVGRGTTFTVYLPRYVAETKQRE